VRTEPGVWNDGGERPVAADQRIGPYRVVRELGRGGMGTVYLCEDTAVGNRPVALKVIHDLHAGTADVIERFHREIRNLGLLRHPNLVQVLYAGEHEGHPYFVMEYVQGRDLNRWLEEIAGWPEGDRIATIVRLMAKVARGVAHAHEKGTVHRDLKPQNILVREDGEPMVLDFGIAKHSEDPTLTATAATPGTPSHMAPEQFEPGNVQNDELIDVWALGTILYFALTRERPFKGQSLASVSYQIVHANPAALRKLNAHVPPALEAVVLKCLEKDPRRRPQSAEDLAGRLDAALHDVVHAARRRKARAVALVGVAAIVLGALLLRPWTWFRREAGLGHLRAVVAAVAGRGPEAGEREIAVPSFQPSVDVRIDGGPPDVMLEAVLATEDGVEIARALLAPGIRGAWQASLRVPADRQREGLRARVLVYGNGELLATDAPVLVMDTTPPRIVAELSHRGVARPWEVADGRIEVASGTELRVVAADATGPVVGGFEIDGRPAGPLDQPVVIAGEGAWSAVVRARDAAGNESSRRFEATIGAPPSRPASAPADSPESRGGDLPRVFGRVTRVGSLTRFDGPASLREGENQVLVENALHDRDFRWSLRVVDDRDAVVAECDLAPQAIFGSTSPRTLGGKLVLRSAPRGRKLRGVFVIVDPAGRERVQPFESPRFLEGSFKPRARLSTAQGDLLVELDRVAAPAAVEAFLEHVRAGDYAGTVFHELRKDQFVKGGVLDAALALKSPPRRPIPLGWERPRPAATRMTVALTGHAEFMIHVRDNPSLALLKDVVEIGRVVEGDSVVAAIAKAPVTGTGDVPNAPASPVAITKAVVELE
jgi:cyclophilin family peptidyl-prolyl cis-trans isomerase/predicted Ser/Thr protein kinase